MLYESSYTPKLLALLNSSSLPFKILDGDDDELKIWDSLKPLFCRGTCQEQRRLARFLLENGLLHLLLDIAQSTAIKVIKPIDLTVWETSLEYVLAIMVALNDSDNPSDSVRARKQCRKTLDMLARLPVPNPKDYGGESKRIYLCSLLVLSLISTDHKVKHTDPPS